MSNLKCTCGHSVSIGNSTCRNCNSYIPKSISGTAICVKDISSSIDYVGSYGRILINDKVRYLKRKCDITGVTFFRIVPFFSCDDNFECISSTLFHDSFNILNNEDNSNLNIESKDIINKDDFSIFKR